MKKNLKEYIIVLIIIILISLLIISVKNNISFILNEVIDTEWQTGNDEEQIFNDNESYSINYADGKYIYNISSSNDIDYIHIKKIVMNKCQTSVDAYCPDNIVDEYNIYLETNEFNLTKNVIKNLYTTYKENNIYNSNLDSYNLNIINNLLSKTEIVDYKITYSSSDGSIKERGYKLTRLNNYILLEVGSGEKPDSCYELELKDIVKSGNDIYMVVDEKELTPDNICMTVISYPSIGIRISDEYNNIIIRDMNNKEYDLIGVNN